MAHTPYTKPHATSTERIAHLRSKGLVIQQPRVTAKKIDLIGYERLRIYFLSRRQLNLPNRPFISGTTCKDILRLYECDKLIRAACFAAVSQFELLLRNSISEALSKAYGSHPYYDVSAFRDSTKNRQALQMFISIYEKSKDPRAKHYQQTYSQPVLPPIWIMKEFLTFGAASRIYQCLDGVTKTSIAAQYGIPKDALFTNWLECLVDLRNICAHHGRLFNLSFPKQPSMLRRAQIPIARSNKLKAILECLDYLLDQRGMPESITDKVKNIIDKYPEVQSNEVGY